MRDDVTNIAWRGTSIVSVQELETQLQRKDILLEQRPQQHVSAF